jgi:CII-binding regulator of phage lambda lysogenization HflD
MKYHECLGNENLKFNWKTLSGFFEFDSKMFLNLYAKIQNYIQNLFELEYKIHKKIEECENISNLMDLDLEILYDNKILL